MNATQNGTEKPVIWSVDGQVARVTLNRPTKRNAISDALIEELDKFFRNIPKGVKVIIIDGAGGHYCSGLDLSEQIQREAPDVMHHSRHWHALMDIVQFSGIPVISVLEGAVMGGGLEIATSTHVRIAEPGTRYRLPEGKRGIFVGGGATVRVAGIIGPDRMTEMMLTGREYNAEEGQALGLSHYLVGAGEGRAKATELAAEIAANSSLINYLVIQSIARIHNMSHNDGLYTESLSAALSQTGPDAREGLAAFLEKRKPRFS